MSIITGGLVIAGAKARGDGFIPISLPTWREVSGDDIGVVGLANPGGILATDSTPAYEYINGATDKGLRLRWAASNVDKIAVSVPLPPDLDDAQPISFHMMAQMAGATDVPPFTIAAFFNSGDSDAGGATGALAAALGEVSGSLAAADVPAFPGFLSLELTPSTHGTDAIDVFATWLEYSKKNA